MATLLTLTNNQYMENPFKQLVEKYSRVSEDVPITPKSPKEYAQFIQDIDTTWMSAQEVAMGGYELMQHLQALPEEDAALLLSALIEPYLNLSLDKRLNAVGMMVGELRPGRLTPSGVRSTLRSGFPMILTTEIESPEYHRPTEIARAIGEMVCGHANKEGVIKFMQAFDVHNALGDSSHPKAIEEV